MKRLALAALCTLVAIATSHAGGPLVLEGPSGNTPVRYDTTIVLNYDQGQLLNSLTNDQADALVNQAIAVWNSVATATVQITQGADLAENITAANYSTVLDETDESTFTDGINPVIYDAGGSVIDDFFGLGQSNNVAGFASSIFEVDGTRFVEGYAVLNGKPILGLNSDDVVTIVIHEIGHLIGMDHSQLDIDNTEGNTAGPAFCSSAASDYPAMYPFLCRDTHDLHLDDIMALTTLYPVSDLDQQFGQLRGNFLDAAGQPVLGANLWVEETATGDKVSIVSDYLMQANGFFSLYLPAGDYTLHANAINAEFSEASGIGPYTTSSSDASFTGIPATLAAPAIIDYQADTGSTVSMPLSVGEAIEVSFRVDGTGSNTGGKTIVDPAAATLNISSGSSSLGPLPVLLVLPLLLLRASGFRRR